MAYATIRRGSRGSDVSALQSALNSKGYNLSVDGIFGSNTQAAVRDYQSKNGLSVDGIVGNNTWNSLNAAQASAQTAATETPAQTAAQSKPDYTAYEYDPSGNEAYQKAMAALEQQKKNAPTYTSQYDAQIKDLYDQITNRDKFTYDINSDALYQQMKDQYVNQGRKAMVDTMGQAAGLTGGYGSSYAQSVGQQQYDAYLQSLNENIPEYYQMARDAYDADTENLYNLYNLSTNAEAKDYDRYRDAYSDYLTERDYLQNRADTEYERGSSNFYNSYNIGMDMDEQKYQRQQDAYDKLANLIGATGYTPTAQELADAGMSEGQANAYRSAYNQSVAAASSGSGGSGKKSGGSDSDKGAATDDSKVKANINSLISAAQAAQSKGKYQQATNYYNKAMSALESANSGGTLTAATINAFLDKMPY